MSNFTERKVQLWASIILMLAGLVLLFSGF
jgi:hypothetical protein